MLTRFRSVRAKLLALVGLSAVLMLVALPMLAWLTRDELVTQAGERVSAGEAAFEVELGDDLTEVTLFARVLAADENTAQAIAARDQHAALRLARRFAEAWPHLDVLLFDETGALLAQVGCDDPPKDVSRFGAATGERGLLLRGGCEAGAGKPFAWVVQVPVASGGRVVACLPFDRTSLDNATQKVRLELAVADDAASLASSSAFPLPILRAAGEGPAVLVRHQGHQWAVASFRPKAVGGGLRIVAARDVSDLSDAIRRQLLLALAVLLAATGAALVLGLRMAKLMHTALGRVSHALRRLEQQEYLHVEVMKTGDELEDLAHGFNAMVDGLKERDKLRFTLGKYMTEKVVAHVLAGKVQLGGEKVEVTILFTDIRSFTTISEKMDAHTLVALLNEYFTEMVAIVMRETGVVDKYIGDALMAVFGAPVPQADDAVHAVRAAVAMRAALQGLNARLVARGLPPLETGIGIHTGEVVAGNIGSEQRMEYTVIGDTVNLASRLESATKEHHVGVLISDATYQRVQHVVEARPVERIVVKGRAQPVMTWELLGLKAEAKVA